jgi:hypothetical protein
MKCENYREKFGDSKYRRIFAALNILEGGITRQKSGLFYALQKIYGSVPPCGVLMHPQAFKCLAAGKTEPFFLFLSVTIISKGLC